jgi:hypothetical protein
MTNIHQRIAVTALLAGCTLSATAWQYRDRLCCLDCPSDYLQSVGVITNSPRKISFEIYDGGTNLLRELHHGQTVDLSAGAYSRAVIRTSPGRKRRSPLCPISAPWTCGDEGLVTVNFHSDTWPTDNYATNDTIFSLQQVGQCGLFTSACHVGANTPRGTLSFWRCNSIYIHAAGHYDFASPGANGWSVVSGTVSIAKVGDRVRITPNVLQATRCETVHAPPGEFFPGGSSTSCVWHYATISLE